jgi:hypothetical protein
VISERRARGILLAPSLPNFFFRSLREKNNLPNSLPLCGEADTGLPPAFFHRFHKCQHLASDLKESHNIWCYMLDKRAGTAHIGPPYQEQKKRANENPQLLVDALDFGGSIRSATSKQVSTWPPWSGSGKKRHASGRPRSEWSGGHER